ncbi:MAG: PEP-CTERM sorting domain-containing protein, partial [Planctomycetes bacterium]|nr:PEP-CTERM sorting domain-containing protein [Planctomycetota bacterium]
YAWLIADATTISGYADTSQFDINADDFTNPTDGTFAVLLGNNPLVTAITGGGSDATQLYLIYTSNEVTAVPEPGSLALAALGLLLGMGSVACRNKRLICFLARD